MWQAGLVSAGNRCASVEMTGKSNDENLRHLGGGENWVAFSRVTLNVQILRTEWHGAENTISTV